MRTWMVVSGIAMMASPSSSNSAVKQLEDFWIDPVTILANLDEYRYLWIKPHGCVWSECAVDDTDDGIVGDNRDGDEQWYQYRTQEFCANAAYSLYGAKKGSAGIFGCNRRHFINSFFTYGGADNLLKAAGVSPIVYYDDGSNASYSTNANCQEAQNGGNNGDGQQGVSSMGCDADGTYVIALFNADTCDGNYFSEDIDPFTDYNMQHETVGCHQIYGARNGDDYAVSYLMNNSWSCDLDLYPNGCPDPYGQKANWDLAVRTVGNGGNAMLAYRNMIYKRPLRITSLVFAAVAFALILSGYKIRNRSRIESKGGNALGFFRCAWEDFVEMLKESKKALSKRLRSRRKRKRKKRRSRHVEDKNDEDMPEITDPEIRVTEELE